MNIKITADSTCDLSADILKEYNIAITPLTVIKAGTGYIDGVTITPAEISPMSPQAAISAPPPPSASANIRSISQNTRANMTRGAYLHQLGLFLYVPPCLHCRGGF